uniref:TIR domain-containing protein n=1 Tax=Periophthalmus magnuspinnatus TaxID=409849 RepID=A0A3B3ZWL5_9GOBI
SCHNSVYNKTFDLRVFTTLIGDCENVTQHRKACYNGLACTLNCPTINTPPNTSVTWQQKYYFQSVKETDQGVYICVRSFPFRGRLYNTTFTMTLETNKNEGIISPDPDEVFFVDLGSPLVINCTALIFLDFTEIYWKISDLSINTSDSLRVKTSFSKENMDEGQKMTASLIFKEVYEEDVSAVFTCILESVSQEPISVNITLAQKGLNQNYSLKFGVYLITLGKKIGCVNSSHRAPLLCYEKSFDAFIMYYMSEQGSGFSGDDMRTLQSVLVDQFGYSLCLFDRDVVPGKAVADAVLECVDQSRAVVLVPGSPDLSYESALLSAIHEALVERQTHLVFIKNKHTKKTDTGLQSDTLQLLTDMGHCIIWESSLAPSSFFWKQLRYYLPPVQESHRISLLP